MLTNCSIDRLNNILLFIIYGTMQENIQPPAKKTFVINNKGHVRNLKKQ